mmetsp:Transcript_22782/g.44201  ORF Transcript_22782/g.44201 Transcript_22782/m.44201 type:complete len:246 (-) Transcript_22782:115-852(-)|eukprot:5635836-Pleurochrysis_carterae.AAC.2
MKSCRGDCGRGSTIRGGTLGLARALCGRGDGDAPRDAAMRAAACAGGAADGAPDGWACGWPGGVACAASSAACSPSFGMASLFSRLESNGESSCSWRLRLSSSCLRSVSVNCKRGCSCHATGPAFGLPHMKLRGSGFRALRARGADAGRVRGSALTRGVTFEYARLCEFSESFFASSAAAAAAFRVMTSRCNCLILLTLSRAWSVGLTPRLFCSSRMPCVGYSSSVMVVGRSVAHVPRGMLDLFN